MAPLIEASSISVQRLGRDVLREVSCIMARGDCVSVIGPNGAGKSTMMAALAGLLPLSAGRIHLEGRGLHDLSRRQIARRLAYVQQIHDGYLGFAVRDVVEAGRYAYVDPLSSLNVTDRDAIDQAIGACRIEHLLERRVETLSGGERQKVWLASALAQQTPMLLLDEPTNALDPAHQVDLLRIIHDYRRSGGTLMVICHDLNLPLALGGRVIALAQGRIVFDEPVDVLHDTARLAAVFGTRFELHQGPGGRSSIHPRYEEVRPSCGDDTSTA